MAQEQGIERLQDIFRTHPGAYRHCQSLPRVLVQNGQHLVTLSIAEFVVDEVDGPDVVRMRGPQADDRTVLVIEPSALLVPLWKLQSLIAPEPFDLIVV